STQKTAELAAQSGLLCGFRVFCVDRHDWQASADLWRASRYHCTLNESEACMAVALSRFVLGAGVGVMLWAGIGANVRSWLSATMEGRNRIPARSGLSPQKVPQPPVDLQPLAQQARRVETALSYLGQPLAA